MRAGVFHQRGDMVPMDLFAQGCFANGIQADLVDHYSANGRPYDFVAVGGNLRRFDHMNGHIYNHYRSLGTPVFVLETGRLLKRGHSGHHWFFYLNNVPAKPPKIEDCERRDMLFPRCEWQIGRGSVVLFIGQDLCFDVDLDAIVAEGLRKFTTKEFVWRPRKGHPYPFKNCDSVSKGNSVKHDLMRAWAVVTHSSNMGGEALMHGIPVLCDPVASYAKIAAQDFRALRRPTIEEVESYLRGMSYLCWSNQEIAEGKALKWFLDTVDLKSY